MTAREYQDFKAEFLETLKAPKKLSGGNYYSNILAKNSLLFSKIILAQTLNGGETYRDAMRYLGIKSLKTFDTFKSHVYGEKEQ